MGLLARRNLFHDKVRFAVTLTGIVFALVLIIIQFGLFLGFTTTTSNNIDHSNADLWVVFRPGSGLGEPWNMVQGSVADLKQEDSVIVDELAIARALAGDPPILLADEPTAALDSTSGRKVIELLQRLARENRRAVVMVTHDPRVLSFGDRIIHLEDGRIVREESGVRNDVESGPIRQGLPAQNIPGAVSL